jgi:hypothetical protein
MKMLRHVIDEQCLKAEEGKFGPHLGREQDREAGRMPE